MAKATLSGTMVRRSELEKPCGSCYVQHFVPGAHLRTGMSMLRT